MVIFKNKYCLGLAVGICLFAGNANALGDQWYVGFGGSGALLDPNPVDDSLRVTETEGVGGNVFFGLDLDDRSSAQLTVYGFGESELSNNDNIPVQAIDGSIVYRLYDSKDARISRSAVSVALYGRFALGYINRDTDLELNNDAAAYFGAGGGLELFLTRNFSIRAEAMYHDRDASSASLQLVGRFGGSRRARSPRPNPTFDSTASNLPESSVYVPPNEPTAPSIAAAPTTPDAAPTESFERSVAVAPPVPVAPVPVSPSAPVALAGDSDGDAIADSFDQCPNSAAGFPVRPSGCPLLDGVLSGIKFSPGTAQLLPNANAQLDFLSNVMIEYPGAKVELHSHADDQGTIRDQAILTRARLREIGTYLVGKGVRSNRLVLRSFGGTRPLYDNATQQGREANNRIEVLEKLN